MNALTSSRPRRGACSEYCKRISGAASSSTILGFQGLPQNSSNQRPTISLLFSADIALLLCVGCHFCQGMSTPVMQPPDFGLRRFQSSSKAAATAPAICRTVLQHDQNNVGGSQ